MWRDGEHDCKKYELGKERQGLALKIYIKGFLNRQIISSGNHGWKSMPVASPKLRDPSTRNALEIEAATYSDTKFWLQAWYKNLLKTVCDELYRLKHNHVQKRSNKQLWLVFLFSYL